MSIVQGRRKSLGFPGFKESSWLLPGDLQVSVWKAKLCPGQYAQTHSGMGGGLPFSGPCYLISKNKEILLPHQEASFLLLDPMEQWQSFFPVPWGGEHNVSLRGLEGICSPKEFHILKELWQALHGFQNTFIFYSEQANPHSRRKSKALFVLRFHKHGWKASYQHVTTWERDRTNRMLLW